LTALTTKQRAKVNAALCIIHDNGFDANAVVELSRAVMATGVPIHNAYERALTSFVTENPDTGPVISKMIALVEASDTATIAQYDSALSQYIETGDNAAMLALAPTIAADSIALAIQNGEITAEQAASGDLAGALGFEPGAVLVAAALPQPAPLPAPAADTVGLTDARAQAHDTSSQVSPVAGCGYVTPKGRAAEAAASYTGFVSVRPASYGLTPQSAYAAARASVVNGSRAIIDAPAEGSNA
jgi:hypothetical protein